MYKTMDEFAQGMREAAAARLDKKDMPHYARLARHGQYPATEAAIAHVRENFEMVEGICFDKPNQELRNFTFYERGSIHEQTWREKPEYRTCALVAKPAPEPKPDVPELARELIDALEAVDVFMQADQRERVCRAKSELRAALDAERPPREEG